MSKATDLKGVGTAIELDKIRHIKFDLNAFVELEEEYGDIQKAFNMLDTGSMKAIRKLLYIGLKWEDETLTEKQVGSMIDIGSIKKISGIIANSITNDLPEDDGTPKN